MYRYGTGLEKINAHPIAQRKKQVWTCVSKDIHCYSLEAIKMHQLYLNLKIVCILIALKMIMFLTLLAWEKAMLCGLMIHYSAVLNYSA